MVLSDILICLLWPPAADVPVNTFYSYVLVLYLIYYPCLTAVAIWIRSSLLKTSLLFIDTH